MNCGADFPRVRWLGQGSGETGHVGRHPHARRVGTDDTRRVLDCGGGNGGHAALFASEGFDVFGVDLGQVHIERCRRLLPDTADHFVVIHPEPSPEDVWFAGEFALVLAIHPSTFPTATWRGSDVHYTFLGRKPFRRER